MSDEKDFVIFVGNISENVTDKLLHELFLQAGPVDDVSLKKGFGFITFVHHESVPYTLQLFEGIQLFGKRLVLKPRDGSMYANMMKDRGRKDMRRSRSFNDFSANPRDSPTNNAQHNMKKIPSLTDIETMKTGPHSGQGFNSWSAGSCDNQYDRRGFERSHSYNHGDPNQVTNDHSRRKSDFKQSPRPNGTPYERSSGNRNFKNSPKIDTGNRDFDSRQHGKNSGRHEQYDRNAYYDKGFNSNTVGNNTNHDNWNRNNGGMTYQSPSNQGGQPYDRNVNRQGGNHNPRYDQSHYRPHHDKPYHRQSNSRYQNDHFGGGGRRH